MPIDNNYLLLALCAVVGAGWKSIAGWMKTVNDKLDELRGQELACTNKFLTKGEYAEGKEHVWKKFDEVDDRLRQLEQRR